MNIKINKQQFDLLLEKCYKRYVYGSVLFGTNNEQSDIDYLYVLSKDFNYEFNSLACYLPNVATFQYDDVENNIQHMIMTYEQFYKNLFSADCNIVADVVLFNDEFKDDALFLCRTHKIIKGYIGLVKRDLKRIKEKNKAFHCFRGIYIAGSLLDNVLPTLKNIQGIKEEVDFSIGRYGFEYLKSLIEKEIESLKEELNDSFEKNEITLYPKFEEQNKLIQMLVDSNNLKEFKY